MRYKFRSAGIFGGLGEFVMGPLHASIAGRCLRRLIVTTDRALRWFSGIIAFESAADGLLLIAPAHARRDLVLSDGSRIRAGDRILELHIWNEHFPRFPANISDRRWAAQVQSQMSSSLHRLASYLRAGDAERIQALCMKPALADRRPANAIARLLLAAGFEPAATQPRRSRPVRFFDSVWVWLLTWTHNPRALIGWRFMRSRHEFWISRSRLVRLRGDRAARVEPNVRPAAPGDPDRERGPHRNAPPVLKFAIRSLYQSLRPIQAILCWFADPPLEALGGFRACRAGAQGRFRST